MNAPAASALFRKDPRKRNKYVFTKRGNELLASVVESDILSHGNGHTPHVPSANDLASVIQTVFNQSAGSHSFEEICTAVAKSMPDAGQRDGTLKEEVRQLVRATLQTSHYVLDGDDMWKLPSATSITEEYTKALTRESPSVSDSSSSPNALDIGNPPLTALQELLCHAILDNGGSCTVDAIHASIAPVWSSLRKPDGSLYNTDCRRAVLASLSHPTVCALNICY